MKKTAATLGLVIIGSMTNSANVWGQESPPGWPSKEGSFYSERFRPDARTRNDMSKYQVYRHPGNQRGRGHWRFRPLPKRIPYQESTAYSMYVPQQNWWMPNAYPMMPYASPYPYYLPYRRKRSWWGGMFDFWPG